MQNLIKYLQYYKVCLFLRQELQFQTLQPMMATLQSVLRTLLGLCLGGGEMGVTFNRSSVKIMPLLASSSLPSIPTGTSVVIPASRLLSGVSTDKEDHSLLSQADKQVAAVSFVSWHQRNEVLLGQHFKYLA